MSPIYPSVIIDKRITSLEYMVTLCQRGLLAKGARGRDEGRSESLTAIHYFYFGSSVPSLIVRHQQSLADFLRAFMALIKEFDTLRSNVDSSRAHKVVNAGRRLLRGRVKSESGPSSPTGSISQSSQYSVTTSEYKSRPVGPLSLLAQPSRASLASSLAPVPQSPPGVPPQAVAPIEFSHLTVMHLPFVPDMPLTFIGLCEVLTEAYRHMDALVPGWQAVPHDVQEQLVKLDDRLCKAFVYPALKEVDVQHRDSSFDIAASSAPQSSSTTQKLTSLLSRA